MKKQHKALAAVIAIVGMPLAFFLLGNTLPKRYTAEMRLLVDQSLQRAQIAENPYQAIDDISEFDRPRSTQTQLDILTGTDVIQAAVALGAEHLPDKIQLNQDASATYENLQRRLAVDNEPNSDILTVRVTENDPEVAAELANDLGVAYAEFVRNIAKQGGGDEMTALDEEINSSKTSLTSLDLKIRDLKAQSRIFDVMQSGESEAGTLSATQQKLSVAQGEYRGAVAALSDAEAQLHTMRPLIPTGQRDEVNPVRLIIEQDLTAERATLADLRTHYYDDFPLVKAQERRIKDLVDQLASAKSEIKAEHYTAANPVYQTQLESVQGLRAQVASLRHQVDSLQAAEGRSSAALDKIPDAEQELQSLLRDRNVAEQNYLALQQRRTVLRSLGVTRQPGARIVSTALPPSQPSFPDSRLLVMAGLVLGVFFAILIVMPRPNGDYNVSRLPGNEPMGRLEAPANPTPELDDSNG